MVINPATARILSCGSPELTPYQFASNSPIAMFDLDGLEGSMGISGSGNVISIGTPIIEFDHNRDLKPDYDEGFYAGLIGTVGSGAAVLSMPIASSAYGAYSTWFAGTSFSAYLSTGTGATLYTYLESAYTMRGLIRTNFGVGAISATTNFTGQVIYNDYNIDENINWSQPLFAGLIKNPFYSNFGESILNVNYGYANKFATEKTLNATGNYFNTNFFSTFGSNLIGSQIGKGFEVQGIGYKPSENILNTFSGTMVETVENKIGDLMKEVAKPKSETKSKKKQSGSSIDSGTKSASFLIPIK